MGYNEWVLHHETAAVASCTAFNDPHDDDGNDVIKPLEARARCISYFNLGGARRRDRNKGVQSSHPQARMEPLRARNIEHSRKFFRNITPQMLAVLQKATSVCKSVHPAFTVKRFNNKVDKP